VLAAALEHAINPNPADSQYREAHAKLQKVRRR